MELISILNPTDKIPREWNLCSKDVSLACPILKYPYNFPGKICATYALLKAELDKNNLALKGLKDSYYKEIFIKHC
jgi:hypothetical protein